MRRRRIQEGEQKIIDDGKMPFEQQPRAAFGHGASGAIVYGALEHVAVDGNLCVVRTDFKPQFHYCEDDFFMLGEDVSREPTERRQ